MKIITFITTSAILSGCNHFGIPATDSSLKEYSTVEQMIVSNFSEADESYSFKDKSGVIWKSLYVGIYSGMAKKPFKDLSRFCQLSGGEFHGGGDDTNKYLMHEKMGFEVGEFVYNTYSKSRDQGQGSHVATVDAIEAGKRYERMPSEFERYNVQQNKQWIKPMAEFFGDFRCKDKGGKTKWVASVYPVGFLENPTLKALFHITGKTEKAG